MRKRRLRARAKRCFSQKDVFAPERRLKNKKNSLSLYRESQKIKKMSFRARAKFIFTFQINL